MPDRYAVIGHPIAQSRSPFIHARFAAQTGHAMTYERIEAPPDAFVAAARAFFDAGGRGLNVTAPFKREAFALADVASDAARQAGAVNALTFEAGRLHADNFDGVGLRADLEINLGVALRGRRVLMVGAGGAARGAMAPLLAAGPAALVVTNRTAATAQALADAFATAGPVRAASLDALADAAPFDVVLQATSAGLAGGLPALPPPVVDGATLVYDMQYAAGPTPFLRWAASHGALRCADGVGMLVEQAAQAFARWRGVRPATAPVIEALRCELDDDAQRTSAAVAAADPCRSGR